MGNIGTTTSTEKIGTAAALADALADALAAIAAALADALAAIAADLAAAPRRGFICREIKVN